MAKISFNPPNVAALTQPPNNKDITFDLRGHNIFARGVEFKGTDTNTWRSVTINGTSLGTKTLELKNGNNISITANGTISAINLASSSHTHPLVINGKSFILGTTSQNLGTYVPWTSNGYSLNVTTKSGNDVDTGGGLYIEANTGTQFYLWLHDTSNVWYKKTATGSWKKMDAGNADTWGGYSAQLTTENTSGTKILVVDGNNVQYRTLSSLLAGQNTWRNIQINGTSIGTNILNLKNGSNIVLNNSNGQVIISASGLASSTHTHNVVINGTTKIISNSTTDLGYYLPQNSQIATWGTLTSANGFTAITHFDLGTRGAFALAGKNSQMFMQLDGTIYVNEGSQEVATKPWVENKGYVTGSVSGNTITINGVSTTWKNTWRDIKINNSSISTNALNIIQGDNITISNSNGTARISTTGLASSAHNHDDRYVRSLGTNAIENYSPNFTGNYIGMTTKSDITSDWWHIIGAAWNAEYRWNSQLALPTQNRNGVYYRSGLNDNSTYGAWIKLLDINNYSDYVRNATITITQNNQIMGSFTLNQPNDATINVANTWRNIQIAGSSIGNNVLNFTSGLYTSSTSNGVTSVSPIGLAAVRACTISSTNYDIGLHIKPYYNSGGPSAYGNILEYVSSNGGGGQLALPWSGSQTKTDGTAVERLKYRSKRDIIKGWTIWKTIPYMEDLNWNTITGKPSTFPPSAHNHTWQSITNKIVASNEFNIVSSGYNNTIQFNYLPIDDRTKTANVTQYIFGNGNKGYSNLYAKSYIKNGSSDSYVLLGGGGHKALSELNSSHNHDGRYAWQCQTIPYTGRLDYSGFFQRYNDSGQVQNNVPFTSWVHLINCQHSNTANNYALQIAASFYNNSVFKIRVTNASDSTAWNTIIHSGNYTEFVSDKNHTHSQYIKRTGDTMSGPLNFANNTWNLVGDDSYIGDCDISGHFGIKAANTTYPGIAFYDNSNNRLGKLTAYSGNIRYGSYSLQFLDNGNTTVTSSTWTNPFSSYNASAVADNQAICVWGQASKLTNLSSDTGDISLWLRRVNASVATLNMVLDGYFWQKGVYRVLDTSDINTWAQTNISLAQYLSSTDTAWYPIVWGGGTHNNTSNSSGQLYKSHDVLSWQTSTQTLYTTNLRAGDMHIGVTNEIYTTTYDLYINYSTRGGKNVLICTGNGNVGIGTTSPGYKLTVNGNIYASSWLRTGGTAGWYSETYGGGWYMSDTNWIRAYNNKGIYSTGRLAIGNIASTGENLNIYSSTIEHQASNDFPGIIPRVISAFSFKFNSYSGDMVWATNIYGPSVSVNRLGVGRYYADISTSYTSAIDRGKIFGVAFLNDTTGQIQQNIHQTLKVQIIKLGIYNGRIQIKLTVSDDASENDMYDTHFDNYQNFYINCYILRI